MEILPGELERVTIPNLEDIHIDDEILNNLLEELDDLVRNDNDITPVLNLLDQRILEEILNIPRETINTFHSIWLTLRNRRLNRGL